MKIQYRKILFSRDKKDKAFGSAEASSGESPEFLYIQSTRNPQNVGTRFFPPALPAGPGPAYGVQGLYSPLREAGMGCLRLEIL
jgi:hypothetical protein